MSELIEVMVDETHILHYAINEDYKRCYIIQTDTGLKYEDAEDLLPTTHTYEATDEIIPLPSEEDVNGS